MIVNFFIGLGVVLLLAFLWFILVKFVSVFFGEDDFFAVSTKIIAVLFVSAILIVICLRIGDLITKII